MHKVMQSSFGLSMLEVSGRLYVLAQVAPWARMVPEV